MPELREAISAAIEAQEEEEKDGPGSAAAAGGSDDVSEPDVSVGEGEDAGAEAAEGSTGTEGEPGAEAQPEGDSAASETPEPGTEGAPAGQEKPGEQAPQGEPPAAAAAGSEKIPVAWRAEARQHWEELPAAVKTEVLRREREVDRALDASAESRRFQEQFTGIVQPYQAFMAADGVDPLTATRNLMQTAAVLKVGSPQQKAGIALDIIRRYGVDIGMLDSMLAGEMPAPGVPGNGNGGAPMDPGMQQYLDQKLAPVNQFMQNIQSAQQNRDAQTTASVDAEIERFASDPDNIFFEDVRDDMAALLRAAAGQGREMTIPQAYTYAVNSRPDLAQIQRQRDAAKASKQQQASLQSKKLAAASVKGTAVEQVPQSQPKTLRGSIEQAWDQHGGGT